MTDEFLKKLHEMSGETFRTIDRYEIGKQLGLSDTDTDKIVDDLNSMGLIKKIVGTKIHITREGKDEFE
jgi:hypothetical protein